MSEWPQYATVRTKKKLRETIQVIPADIGQELYELLCDVLPRNVGPAEDYNAIQNYRRALGIPNERVDE